MSEAMTTESRSDAVSRCPSDESLVAAFTGALSADEQHHLDAHLDSCDRCLDAVDALLRRLRLADAIAVPVPDAVRERATAAAQLESAAASPPRRPAPARAGLW